MNDSPWERAPFYGKFKKQSEFRLRVFGILLAPALRAMETCGVRDGRATVVGRECRPPSRLD